MHDGVCVMRRRRASLSSADQAATRRMVQGVFKKVVTTQGKGLGEVLLCTHSASPHLRSWVHLSIAYLLAVRRRQHKGGMSLWCQRQAPTA